MSSSGKNSKRSSRWGAAPAAPAPASTSVSDEDALRALLAESEQAQREKERQQQSKKNPPIQQEQTRKKRFDHTKQEEQDSYQRKRYRTGDDDKKAVDRRPKNDYYGPAASAGAASADETTAGRTDDAPTDDAAAAVIEKQKPDFGLSGALAQDESGAGGSNVYKGVLLKFQEPPEARTPHTTQWRFYVFKGEEQIETLHVSKQSAYLWGRNEEIADIPLQHPSCSSQHAVLQYRALPHQETGKLVCQPYLMDLESTNGSFINGVRIDSARYYQLKKGDVLRFGASTREYVLLTANTKSVK